MTEIILKGHKVAKGRAQGEALVSKSPISFLGGVDSDTGIIVEQGHELEGMSVADKILIFPIGKGSTGGSYKIYELACNNKAPRAIINLRADPVVAVGAIMGSIPMMDIPEEDPFEIIKTGDFVVVDADQGIVRVRSKSS